jgi:hypothetical protein
VKVINQDGEQLFWTAVYARYHHRYDERCDDREEALAMLHWGQEYGELAPLKVVSPSGETLEGEALQKALEEYERSVSQVEIEGR